MLYYPARKIGTAGSDVAKVPFFRFRRMSVGLDVKYSDTKFLQTPQVETEF